MLKQSLIALALVATPAVAQQNVSQAQVQDFYSYYTERVPKTERVCKNIQVPIYETRNKGASGGDILGGLIIGGLLGKAVTGNDKGAAAGAVIGGVATADSKRTEQVITGYRTDRQCDTVESYREVKRKQYDYSVLTFKLDGQSYNVTFEK